MKNTSLILASVVSAFLASTCCLAPLLFLLFGIGMGSLSFLQVFAPYHDYFAFFAIALIVYLWYDYFKTRKSQISCTASVCKNYRLYLIAGTIFVALFSTYPWWIGALLE